MYAISGNTLHIIITILLSYIFSSLSYSSSTTSSIFLCPLSYLSIYLPTLLFYFISYLYFSSITSSFTLLYFLSFSISCSPSIIISYSFPLPPLLSSYHSISYSPPPLLLLFCISSCHSLIFCSPFSPVSCLSYHSLILCCPPLLFYSLSPPPPLPLSYLPLISCPPPLTVLFSTSSYLPPLSLQLITSLFVVLSLSLCPQEQHLSVLSNYNTVLLLLPLMTTPT